MAKQVGPLFFTGTIDGLIFYKLGNQYYTRSKGSYKSAKHMRRNPKYKRTLEKADQFGQASKMAQEVYYQYLPKAFRKHGLFGKLTGMANDLLQLGKTTEEIKEQLIAYCQSLQPKATQHKTTTMQRRTTNNEQRPSHTDQRPTINPKPATNHLKPKQARYLSHWKVKPNGLLQVPNTEPSAHLPLAYSHDRYLYKARKKEDIYNKKEDIQGASLSGQLNL